MLINSEILDAYLTTGSMAGHENIWLFNYLEKLSGRAVFSQPNYSPDDMSTIRRIGGQIREEIRNFRPNNQDLWDLLFPDWLETISDISVNLIVGLPPGFDALTLQIADKNPQIVYDVGNWLAYQNRSIFAVANNLLTHELAHVCIAGVFPKITRAYEQGTYGEKLDVITFDEGFAHLLAFENKNIASVDWNSPDYRRIYTVASEQMETALRESDEDKQRQYLFSAAAGNYYEKFGAMVGMFYLAGRWVRQGNEGIKKAFHGGWQNFASTAMGVK